MIRVVDFKHLKHSNLLPNQDVESSNAHIEIDMQEQEIEKLPNAGEIYSPLSSLNAGHEDSFQNTTLAPASSAANAAMITNISPKPTSLIREGGNPNQKESIQ